MGMAIFLALTGVWMSVRHAYITGSALPVRATIGSRREQLLVGLVGVGMLGLPLLFIATPLLDITAFPNLSALLIVGLIFGTPGVWLFWRSHADLGANWSPVLEIRDGHSLITHGVYGRMRHPMYAAIFLLTLAQACLLSSWIAGPSGFATFLVLFLARIDSEERMMATTFGSAWSEYCTRTTRLWPMRLQG